VESLFWTLFKISEFSLSFYTLLTGGLADLTASAGWIDQISLNILIKKIHLGGLYIRKNQQSKINFVICDFV
jgi:hypothetical protein